MLDALFNLVMTIAVYCFVVYLFWQALQTILQKIRPKEPPIEDYGGREYE